MVWALPDRQLANLVIAPFKPGPVAFDCVHNEFHNGANMCELRQIVARHQPQFEAAKYIRPEDSHEA